LKFLFLNNYHYLRGGSERVFFGEIKLLKSYGHEVHSFARRHQRDLPASFSALFPEDIKTDSLHISLNSLRTLKEIIYSKETRNALSKVLEKFSPDLAHAHNIYGRLTTAILDLLHENNIPVVLTLHDYKLVCPSYKLMYDGHVCEDCRGKNFYMAVWNKCHKKSIAASAVYALESYFNARFNKYSKNVQFFISPSIFLRQKLIEFGWPAHRIKYIPNYLILSDFEPQFGPGKYFLYLGRLSPEKGVATLIKAFKRVRSKNAELLIVGEGEEKKTLEALADGDERIRFTGYLAGKELTDVTRNALAVVVPSEWYENAPISVLEAMAYGKPVIASRIGGIPEVIDENETGYLFEPGNVDEMAAKLGLVLSSPQSSITEMGKAARKKVEHLYNENIHYEKLMEIYQKALRQG